MLVDTAVLLETWNAYILPASAGVLCLYPLVVFLRMLSPGLRSGRDLLQELNDGRIGACTCCAALLAVAPLLLFPGLGFLAVPKGTAEAVALEVPDVKMYQPAKSPAFAHISSMSCLIGVTTVFAAVRSLVQTVRERPRQALVRKPSGILCHASKELTSPLGQGLHGNAASAWHKVNLVVQNWLDEDTGLLRFVNEMPRGSLQKFELQTSLEDNVIREDVKGSNRLKSFGKLVPFNYGCFPQTFRDPFEHDELHQAPGDNDPLDVIDVSLERLKVGEVVRCRPLGAVCLIDEGQADWKILVVNADEGPGKDLRSMAEVENMWPGRTREILTWMDEFKSHSNTGATKLHFEVHGVELAMSIIQKDHAAWRRLLLEADSEGFARGHWIRPKRRQQSPDIIGQVSWPASHALTGTTKPMRQAHHLTSRGSFSESDSSSSD